MKLTLKQRNEITLIHIGAAAIGMDTKSKDPDSEYRRMLWSYGRVTSSLDLDDLGRLKVIEYLKSRGFVPTKSKKSKTNIKLSDAQQHKMIRGMWLELFDMGAVHNSSEEAILRFVKNQTGVDRMEWLKTYQANQLVEALKSWIAREKRKVKVA